MEWHKLEKLKDDELLYEFKRICREYIKNEDKTFRKSYKKGIDKIKDIVFLRHFLDKLTEEEVNELSKVINI